MMTSAALTDSKNSEELKKRLLFPFDEIRKSQKDMLLIVENCIHEAKHLIVHAPTGMGKTIATIGPAIKYAIENKKTVFFLTSRHTQHEIAIETLKMIQEKFGTKIRVSDIIGKKWMCLQPGIDNLYSGEFADYCKKLVEEDKCEFYNNLKTENKLTTDAKVLIEQLKKKINSTDDLIRDCGEKSICPYYTSAELALGANIIIADYFYMFSPRIRGPFLKRTQKELEDAIVIVDEGHNLGNRIRDLQTARLSSNIIKRSIKEAKKYNKEELIPALVSIQDYLNINGSKLSDETTVKKDDFINHVNKELKNSGSGKGYSYEDLVADMYQSAEDVRDNQRQSYLGSVASFLDEWRGDDKGFVRILSIQKSKVESTTVLSYRCLDPSLLTKEVFESAHSAIMMSGTLTPTNMYRNLLGFPARTIERVYKSPFKESNKLNIIVPETSTKYTARSETQYTRIAEICAGITNAVPGNTAIFFPSYFVRDAVAKYFDKKSKKTTLQESPRLSKAEKSDLLERFKKYSKSGAVLLGVASGSFGEGIDLPGDLLKSVIVVGLPLQRPDLETKALIDYFDKKFGKGWDYGYLYPAFNKAIQSAGRCIRKESDRGVIVFVDERYVWTRYHSLFPEDWEFRATRNPVPEIEDFFRK